MTNSATIIVQRDNTWVLAVLSMITLMLQPTWGQTNPPTTDSVFNEEELKTIRHVTAGFIQESMLWTEFGGIVSERLALLKKHGVGKDLKELSEGVTFPLYSDYSKPCLELTDPKFRFNGTVKEHLFGKIQFYDKVDPYGVQPPLGILIDTIFAFDVISAIDLDIGFYLISKKIKPDIYLDSGVMLTLSQLGVDPDEMKDSIHRNLNDALLRIYAIVMCKLPQGSNEQEEKHQKLVTERMFFALTARLATMNDPDRYWYSRSVKNGEGTSAPVQQIPSRRRTHK